MSHANLKIKHFKLRYVVVLFVYIRDDVLIKAQNIAFQTTIILVTNIVKRASIVI